MAVYYPQCRATLSIVFDGFKGSDSNPTVVQVIPTRASAHLNGYKEADTFDLEFDARQLPLSPELIRNMQVELYMFELEGGLAENPQRYAVDDNLVVAGLADNVTLQYSADGGTVHADGRDYTCLFLDKQWKPTDKVPAGVPLDQAILALANQAQIRTVVNPDTGIPKTFKPTHPLTVEFRGQAPAPVVGAAVGHDRKLTQKKVSGKPPVTARGHSSASRNGIPFKSGQSYWDVMYKLCLRMGFICFVQGTTIVISDPKVLSEAAAASSPKMAWGRNLDSLSFERHIGRETVPQIVIACYDKDSRKALEAHYPDDKNFKGKQTGFGTFKDEQRRYVVTGVKDVAILQRMARNLYHNLARSEGKMRFTTIDLRDLPPSPGVAGPNNLLSLRAGGAVSVKFDPFIDSEMRALATPELRYQHMLQLGYSQAVSRLVADNYEHLKQAQQPWYVRTATFDWDVDSGMAITVEGVNFISQQRDDAP